MNTLFIGQHKITLQTVDSTNNYATNLLKVTFVPDGTVIMAQNQTNGKGQRANRWLSEPNANLLCSFVFSPKQFLAENSFELSMITSLAVCETVSHYCSNEDVNIKWPNDIILNDKKVGGILIENSMSSQHLKSVIIGVGLNVNQREFEFSHATSLCNEVNSIFDTDLVLETLCQQLEKWCLLQRQGNLDLILDAYTSLMWQRDQLIEVTVLGKTTTGKITGVTKAGKLNFESEGQTLNLDFGDIKIPYA